MSSKRPLSVSFQHQKPACISLSSHTRHVPFPNHSPFYRPTNILWIVQTLKLVRLVFCPVLLFPSFQSHYISLSTLLSYLITYTTNIHTLVPHTAPPFVSLRKQNSTQANHDHFTKPAVLTHWGRGHLNCLNARSRVFFNNFNPLNAKLNPICYLLALLAHHFLHVSRIRVKSLTLRLLMSYIYDISSLRVKRT